MGKKAKPKNKRPSKRYAKYKIIGDKIERGKTCPKCGPAIFLADHKDRMYCGRCHYCEIKSK